MRHPTDSQTQRGEASDRIVSALAAEAPNLFSRQSFLRSKALRHQYGNQELTPKEQLAAAKTLGRLIAQNVIGETIFLRGDNDKIDLPETGLIAVSVSLAKLKVAFDEWKANPDEKPEPRQELIVENIQVKSLEWMEENRKGEALPLLPINISIIHGSSAFDILITVMYRHSQIFMKYIREVIQRIDGVDRTQTMQIASSIGFPSINTGDNEVIVTKS